MATRAAKLALRGKALSDTGTEIGIVNNADATAITVDSNENVGINNSSPTQRLEINGNAQFNMYDDPSGAGGYYTTKGMQIGNAFDAGLSGGDDDRNAIVWNERGTSLLFGTNNTEAMRIDSAGNVGIGTASPSARFEVEDNGSATGNVIMKVTQDDQSSHYGMSVGNDAYSTTDTDGFLIYQANNGHTYIYNGGAGLGANIGMPVAGGITFGMDTAAANALDDYEEGTWTPSITRDSNPSIGSYAVRYGSYTKIGNQVTLFCEVVSSTVSGGSGYWYCTGLPFSSAGINANTTVGRNYMSGDTNDRDFRIQSNVAKLITTSADTYYQGNITYVIWTFTTTFQVS
jgi:hypothetical protein